MSAILGPQAGGGSVAEQHDGTDDDELFVFGYACKLFRDDAKALLENSGQMLIPWMGDGSLMVDRYDIRNRLEDKGQFGLKPILPRRRTEEEEELEEQLDHERFLALGVDILERELLEEETKKRSKEHSGSYQAVGFAYKESVPARPAVSPRVPPRPEHPPSSTVDVAENETERFVLPDGLVVPAHIRQPVTKKLHAIIERTAGFVARQGTQMEIMIKAKQKYNPLFSFLSLYDPLYSYYRLLLQLIGSGQYTPVVTVERGGGEGVIGGGGDGERKGVEEPSKVLNEESDSEDSDEEGFELHPLLRVSTTPRSSPKPPGTKNPPDPPTSTTQSDDHRSPLPAFYSKSLTVNSAPYLDQSGLQTSFPHPSLESQQTTLPPEGHHPNSQYFNTDRPSLHPQPSDYSSQDNLEAYYHRLREEHINNKMGGAGGSGPYPLLLPGPPPPPPELQPIIDKMAEYVARNSEDFERTVLEKHVTDPKFGFLNPWNKFYPYYKWRLRQNKERATEQALAAIEHDYQQQRAKEETLRGEKIQKLSQSGAVSFKLQPKKVTKVMDSATVDLGHAPEDEEEEQKEEQYNTAVETGESYVPQQVNYQTMQQAGYTTIEQDDSQIMLDMTNYHHDNAMRLHPQSYPEEHVHYSSEGMYYCPTSNGEVQGEDGDESLPASKRPKTAAADENTVVMDNKVQEFLSQVKAVLDT